MNESSKKIQELTEAMRAEKDIRIRSMMMAVLGVLEGHYTRTASDFADVDRRTAQLWTVRFDESGIGGLWDALGKGRVSCARYGRIKRLADRLAAKNTNPEKSAELDTRQDTCQVQTVQYAGSCMLAGTEPDAKVRAKSDSRKAVANLKGTVWIRHVTRRTWVL